MIEEAIIDAYGETEQTVGFVTMLEEHLRMPFQTVVLGVEVTVRRVDVTEANDIVAVCQRGRARQIIPILSLPLPTLLLLDRSGSRHIVAGRAVGAGRRWEVRGCRSLRAIPLSRVGRRGH